MPAVIECTVDAGAWRGTDLGALATQAVAAALAWRGLSDGAWEVTVLGCTDRRIAELNAGFRGKPAPTNVLSWPAAERRAAAPGQHPAPPRTGPGGDPSLGDIAIADAVCASEAAVAGIDVNDHVRHLLVHATLHLLGYDHADDADAALMERAEVEILATMGLADPYDRDSGPRRAHAG